MESVRLADRFVSEKPALNEFDMHHKIGINQKVSGFPELMGFRMNEKLKTKNKFFRESVL